MCDENICDYNRFKTDFFLSTHFRSCFVNVCNVYISIGPQTMSFAFIRTHEHTFNIIYMYKLYTHYYIYLRCCSTANSPRARYSIYCRRWERARACERDRELDKIYEFEFSRGLLIHTHSHTCCTARAINRFGAFLCMYIIYI